MDNSKGIQMLNFYSGFSKAVNPKKAVKESLSMILPHTTEKITMIILHSTSGHNHSQLLNAINEELLDVQIIGCTGSGVVSNGFVNETVRSIAMMAITGKELVTSKIEGITAQNCFELSQIAANELKVENKSINIVMAFAPGLIVNGEDIINGITSVFSDDVPILGGYNVLLCQDHLNQHSYFTHYATSSNSWFCNSKLLMKSS